MNTADQRLRAAARDAARLFPAGGDLPPLRLPDPASRHGRARLRAGIGGPGGLRAWASPLAAAAAVAAIAVAAGLVAPAGQPRKPPASGLGAGVRLTRGQIRLLTGTAREPWVTYALAENATQAATQRCMHARGLVFFPFLQRTAAAATMATLVPGVPQAAISLAARQAHGYGFYAKGVRHATHPGSGGRPGREDRYLASLPAGEKHRYLLAVFGLGNPKRSVTIPGIGGHAEQVGTGGCLAAARRQVYGSLANFVLVVIGWGQLQGHLKPVQADPAFSAVIARWSACMADHGYQYRSPDNLWNRLGPRVYSSPTPANRALEIRTAVQDYRCSQAVRLIHTIKALQVNHARNVSKAVAHDLTRITHIFAHVLTAARRLHIAG